MGNNSTRESRDQEPTSPTSNNRNTDANADAPGSGHGTIYSSRPGRASRPDLSFLGLGSSNARNEVPERRETRQEREARKLERERAARLKERERSIKEEHVDGGFLVTMGVYTGIEDFNKSVVRSLMIERRIAPFWRGLDDFNDNWAEHQLVAAARGLPIPAADEIPREELTRPLPPNSAEGSSLSLQNLTVPISSRSPSAASDASTPFPPSHAALSNQSPVSPAPTSSSHSSLPFHRARVKTVASLAKTSINTSSTELAAREVQLPRDPYVNGQAIEVFLYKNATECPICFLYYPPYLNKTRCCDQSICSECFVQIKRPDPHIPEHHDPSNPPAAVTEAEAEGLLVSEPACCPYCQQPEFGVTYDPPPFRRGLVFANNGVGTFASAMSSSSSLNSTNTPTLSPGTHKRRLTAISANAPTVITTDKVRPDWATKLAAARSHLARRSAAATALHTAAYLVGNGPETGRNFGFSGRPRFGRHRGESNAGGDASGAATPSSNEAPAENREQVPTTTPGTPGTPANGRRRSRMDDLEDMMMAEAIRQSLVEQEDMKKKAEKMAKKKAKEEKKREKKEKKGVYGSGASSTSGSVLSLGLPGLGRRRGNSGASNLQREVMPEDAETSNSKGKSIDRGVPSGGAPENTAQAGSNSHDTPVSRHLDGATAANMHDFQQSSPSPTVPDRPSHLRQMSNASSPASSFMESVSGSLKNELNTHGSSSTADTPNTSRDNITSPGSEVPDGGDAAGNAGPESMFNFQSLAAMIGKDDDDAKQDAARHIEHLNGEGSNKEPSDHSETDLEESVATLRVGDTKHRGCGGNCTTDHAVLLELNRSTPELIITPVTPAALNHDEEDSKQLGGQWSTETSRAITQ